MSESVETDEPVQVAASSENTNYPFERLDELLEKKQKSKIYENVLKESVIQGLELLGGLR